MAELFFLQDGPPPAVAEDPSIELNRRRNVPGDDDSSSTTGQQQQQQQPAAAAKPPPRKRTCIRSSEDPDVVITVGGVEYEEYSSVLRCWSGYFDAALRSGMQETRTRRFEFPDRKPEEWEFIVALMAPMSSEKITPDNVNMAISWFDELCCTVGLKQCETVLTEHVVSLIANTTSMTNATAPDVALYAYKLLEVLNTGVQYNLDQCKNACFEALGGLLSTPSLVHKVEKGWFGQLCLLVKEQEECHAALWDSITKKLPDSLSQEQQKLLLEQDVLHEVIYLKVQNDHLAPSPSPAHEDISSYARRRAVRFGANRQRIVNRERFEREMEEAAAAGRRRAAQQAQEAAEARERERARRGMVMAHVRGAQERNQRAGGVLGNMPAVGGDDPIPRRDRIVAQQNAAAEARPRVRVRFPHREFIEIQDEAEEIE